MKLRQGDIFEVKTSKDTKQFFQFLFKNENELGGDMIRAFEYEIANDMSPNIDEILKGPIKFYAHTMVNLGVKLGLWRRIENRPIEPDFEQPTFRGTDDVYSMIKKSKNWYLKKGGEVKFIGELNDEYKKLPLVGITPCASIIAQLETGWDGFKTPE